MVPKSRLLDTKPRLTDPKNRLQVPEPGLSDLKAAATAAAWAAFLAASFARAVQKILIT